MLNEIVGNVFDMAKDGDTICILTNTTIVNGENIMGAGIAREAVVRNPNKNIKKCVANSINIGENVFAVDEQTNAYLYRFDTKDNVFEDSKLNVIENSLITLCKYIDSCKNLQIETKVYLPRPGCGCGGLDWETQVKPLCDKYLNGIDNVFIVSF